MAGDSAATLVELRVLDGPNLYFTLPAIKLTLGVTGWLRLREARAAHQAARFRLPEPSAPGAPNNEQRRRFMDRLAAHVTRSLAKETGTHLAVRGRPGPFATKPDRTGRARQRLDRPA